MVIVAQGKAAFLQSHNILKMIATSEGKVCAVFGGNERENVGTYENMPMAKFALEMCALALSNDEDIFYFPNNNEVREKMTIHRNAVTKYVANSHGGS